MIIPKHLQIETVNGMCTANCIMCTINQWNRKKHIMSNEDFTTILSKFKPYIHQIEYLTMHGCGEALLDKDLAEKIRIAKDMGFKGTGFATNCTELDLETSKKIIEAGLDTIICSIDGINSDTHEAIRIGTKFKNVVENVLNFIKLRNTMGSTRVMVRFIRMEKNKNEWDDFLNYWESKIYKGFGDVVVKFDVHNWGDDISQYDDIDINKGLIVKDLLCSDVFERMLIYADGSVGLCCADDNGFYNMGNVIIDDPIKIYNNSIFTEYRKFSN